MFGSSFLYSISYFILTHIEVSYDVDKARVMDNHGHFGRAGELPLLLQATC